MAQRARKPRHAAMGKSVTQGPGRLHHISNADKDFEQVVLVPTR